MKRYSISCEVCGSHETGYAYPGERIRHAHTWTGSLPFGRVVITVTS